jgi:DNA-binding NarL/FixJ family response regulator
MVQTMAEPGVLNVFIVDDHNLVRSGIRALIEAAPNLNVVGEASDGREAVEQIQALQPELVLMDVAMSGLNGIDAARQVHAALPQTRIIMLSMHEDRQYVFEALKAGATGYVLKSAAFQDLIAAIETVMSNRNYISPALSDTVMNDYIRRAQGEEKATELGRLSGREREVLQLIAEGKSSAEVGELLHISVRTVDTHRHNIMTKLEIHSIAGLTKFAIRHGLCVLN